MTQMATDSSSFAPLLTHAEFLRHLAIQLAGSQDGEDLAQDSWVAAMRGAPANVREPRGLLRVIATNLWRNASRGRRRQLRREAAAATPGDEPSVAAIAEREEARQKVVAAVLALPQPLRQVVLLHFYEGLTSPQIGERLQLSPSGVRTRMQAALQHLRQRLDAEYGGDRRAWVGPLLAWQHFGSPVATTGLALQGTLRMGAVLLAVLGGVWWWSVRGDPAPEPAATIRATAAPRESSGWIRTEEPARRPVWQPEATPPAMPAVVEYAGALPTGALRGVVRDEATWAPLGDVAVQAQLVPCGTSEAAPLVPAPTEPRRARTDAAGEFHFVDLPAGLYEVHAAARDARVAHDRVAIAAGGAVLELSLREQPQRGAFAVKVRDSSGRAVPGAAVQLHLVSTGRGAIGCAGTAPIRGLADANGNFVVRDHERIEHVFEGLVLARCGDGRVGLQPISRPEHRGVNPYQEVVVAAPGRIEGQLTGIDGLDLSAVTVAVQALWTYDMLRPAAVEFDVAVRADGGFTVEVPAGRFHLDVRGLPDLCRELTEPVDSSQFLPAVVVVAGKTTPTEVALCPAAVVRGEVRGSGDVPLVGGVVTARWAPEPAPWYWHRTLHHDPSSRMAAPYTSAQTVTDAAGRYTLPLRTGQWDLTVTAPGHSLDVHAGLTVEADGLHLEHRLTRDGALRGRTQAHALGLRAEAAGDSGSVMAISVHEGWFALRGLSPGRWQVGELRGSTFAPITTVAIAAGAATFVDLVELASGVVRGAVVHEGVPVEGLEVRSGSSGVAAVTGPDGTFALRCARGPHDALQIVANGLVLQTVELGRHAGSDVHVGTLELHARRLDLRAVDAAGVAVAALLEIEDPDSSSPSRVRTLRADGVLAGHWVPGKAANLVARAVFADGATSRQRVSPEQTAVQLVHRPAGTIVVRVLDAEGAPRPGAALKVEAWGNVGPAPTDGATFHAGRARDAGEWWGTTDPQGTVTLRGVPAGPALVYFRDRWSRYGYGPGIDGKHRPPPAELVVAVEVGQVVHAALVLPR